MKHHQAATSKLRYIHGKRNRILSIKGKKAPRLSTAGLFSTYRLSFLFAMSHELFSIGHTP
jgi:hypothetical protein